jgi:hypothetical protein
MLSAWENYCPDQVTFSGAEPSHPTTPSADICTKVVNLKLFPTIKLIKVNFNITAIILPLL